MLIIWLISTTCLIRWLPEMFRRIFQQVVQHITIRGTKMQRRTIGERMIIDGAKMEIRSRSLNLDPSTKLTSKFSMVCKTCPIYSLVKTNLSLSSSNTKETSRLPVNSRMVTPNISTGHIFRLSHQFCEKFSSFLNLPNDGDSWCCTCESDNGGTKKPGAGSKYFETLKKSWTNL